MTDAPALPLPPPMLGAAWSTRSPVVETLAAWARDRDPLPGDTVERRTIVTMRATLLENRLADIERGLTVWWPEAPEMVHGWLAAVVAEKVADWNGTRVLAAIGPDADPGLTRRWFALGEVGPLALAAGLSIEEAEARRAAGTLDGDRLATLAGLRGWVFPPLP